MPGEIKIEVVGAKELQVKLDLADRRVFAEASLAMPQAIGAVRENAGVYPPETEANSPPPPYYIRGVGTQYRTFNRLESENLGDSWKTDIEHSYPTSIVGKAFPTATYAPWVHLRQKQAWFHALRAWRTDERILADMKDRIVGFFKKAVDLSVGMFR